MINPKKVPLEQQLALAVEYTSGATIEQLGDKYGCSPGTVRNVLLFHGVEMRPSGQRPQPLTPTKTCSVCGNKFPREVFGKKTACCPECLSQKRGDLYASNPAYRQARIDQARAWQETHPSESRAKKRQWHSGWTQEQFDAAWEAQRGRCAICEVPMEREGTNPNSVCADHDHKTELRRDLLCSRCNKHLGIYEKHREKFNSYLNKHQNGGVQS